MSQQLNNESQKRYRNKAYFANTDKPRTDVSQIITSLAQDFSSFLKQDENRYQEYLRTMARFHKYSVNNTMLIFLQRPEASYINSYSGWKSVGRMVKKGEKGKYYKVATPDGREGFVLKKHAAALEEWANQTYDFKTIEKNARKMMGRPYLWGGMAAKMADCSGFVRTSYFSNGIILQRDASQQALTGKKVDSAAWRTEAEPGDLIFIGSTSGKVTHVAMYVGGGKYIHSSGRVKVNSMDPKADDYLDYHFISISRINN